MTPSGQFDASRVQTLLQELSDRLATAGVQAQLFVVGGAAMALAYDADRLTRDVDALFVPAPEVRQIIEEMSGPHGLEPDWLNDAVKGFLPGGMSTRTPCSSPNRCWYKCPRPNTSWR
ncbi:hypothetical protein BN12_530023 [Nostocoides japonicum T1-X7]|uniref:DUF6036 domain-containing protein n=1 Tax=Nostocoides japonicum T1-X7 TaxID=1194083 RepID=A0A077M6C9_9MICO|nr:DUF6036 family nucleotidyltransferase [Tetrasphaera japonica]CCH79689.1 hypothetical protein BN12_530023 [Tetrasphaera japonica T1-X7]